MPSNKNAVIRYMFLDKLLSDRLHRYTCEELFHKVNERLEEAGYPTIGGDKSDYDRYIKSGKRVIQLDIQALQDSPFNMEIDSSEKRYGSPIYRYADQTQSLFRKPLSDDEKRLLQEVLNTLGQFAGLDNFEWLHDLQEKLNDRKAFGRNELDHNCANCRKIISFSTNEELRNKDYLAGLFSAISNRRVVMVEYLKFGHANKSKITLYPYLLKQYNDRWYLIGTPLGDKDFPFRPEFLINLPLDRIESYSEVPGKEYQDYPGDIDAHFDDIIGVTYYENEEKETIIFAIANDDAPYIRTKKIHWTQEELGDTEQADLHRQYPHLKCFTFFSIMCIPNYELKRMLCGFGGKLVVVSPRELREGIRDDLKAQLSLYTQ